MVRLLGRSRDAAPGLPAPRTSLGAITFPTVDGAFRVGRDAALSLSVVANAVELICGIASQLTVDLLRGDVQLDAGTILTAPDPDLPWPTTVAELIDDLIFYGGSYWLVLRRDADGFPTRARRLPWSSVAEDLNPDYARYSRIRGYTVNGQSVPVADVIRFKARGRGILRDYAATLLDALNLSAAAARHATVPLPAGVLTNTGQEIGDEDARAVVTAFDQARVDGTTAFLQSMTYERTALNAADLQLVEAQAAMDSRLARILNVPVATVAASPTGNASAQLYANVVASFTQLIQQAIAPYLRVIEDTFSLQQVTPRGQRVAFDTGDWLRFAQVAVPSPGLNTPTSPSGTEAQ